MFGEVCVSRQRLSVCTNQKTSADQTNYTPRLCHSLTKVEPEYENQFERHKLTRRDDKKRQKELNEVKSLLLAQMFD